MRPGGMELLLPAAVFGVWIAAIIALHCVARRQDRRR